MTTTRTRILDATLAVAGREGITGLTLEVVADEAGVSRQTVYRHFGSREGLVSAVIVREEEAMARRITAAAAAESDLYASVRAALLTALRLAAEHPLLQRLLATEPEALLPFLTSSRGPVLDAARPVMVVLLRERLPDHDVDGLRRLADVTTRLIISYTTNPSAEPREVVADTLATLVVRSLVALGPVG